MNPCKITEDLLPLYVDNTCSDDSREYVENHPSAPKVLWRLSALGRRSTANILRLSQAAVSLLTPSAVTLRQAWTL